MKIFLIILAIFVGVIGLVILGLVIAAIKRRPKFNNKGFTQLERRLLSELFELFDLDIQSKLKTQTKYFEPNRKWRQYWEKSMSMELYSDNKNPLSDQFLYNRKDESKLATIKFKVNSEIFSIEFSNYNGRLWGWKIRPNPKKIQKFSEIEIIDKKVLNDPNDKVEVRIKKTEFKSIPTFDGLISDLTKFKQIKKAYKPLLHQQIEIFKEKIDSKLPEDYLNIIEQTEGLEFDDFRISGISEIQRTRLDDGDYFHLVEFDDGIITIKEKDQSGEVYYCHYSGGMIDKLGTDFKRILINKIKNDTTTNV